MNEGSVNLWRYVKYFVAAYSTCILISVLAAVIFNIDIGAGGISQAIISAMLVSMLFAKENGRLASKQEHITLTWRCFLSGFVVTAVALGLFIVFLYIQGGYDLLMAIFNSIPHLAIPIWLVIFVFVCIVQYGVIYFAFGIGTRAINRRFISAQEK